MAQSAPITQRLNVVAYAHRWLARGRDTTNQEVKANISFAGLSNSQRERGQLTNGSPSILQEPLVMMAVRLGNLNGPVGSVKITTHDNLMLRCKGGSLWVTMSGCAKDWVLDTDQRLNLEIGREVTVSGMPSGELELIRP